MLFLSLLLSFISFYSSIKCESLSPILVPYEERYGLLRLAPFCLFLGLWILLQLISTRLACWAFFLSFFFFGPILYFFFLLPEGDHPSVVGPSVWPMGQCVPLPILHGYPFSLGFYSPFACCWAFSVVGLLSSKVDINKNYLKISLISALFFLIKKCLILFNNF